MLRGFCLKINIFAIAKRSTICYNLKCITIVIFILRRIDMFQNLANMVSTNMQNVYTPLPFKVHLIFCLLATILYIVQFYRKHSVYYLLIMAAIDLTFITQIWTNKPVIIGLFVAEVILILLAVISSFVHNKKIKAQNSEAIEKKKQELAHKKEIEEQDVENDKKIVDNAFDDEGLE